MANVAITSAARRGVVDAGVGVTDQDEKRQPATTTMTAPSTWRRTTLWAVSQWPSRSAHDRRHEQRLDNDELAAVQRQPLGRIAGEEHKRPQQPHRDGE